MPLIVWTADPDGTVDYSSRAMFEYTKEPDMNLPAAEWATVIHPDDVETVHSAWTEAVRSGSDYSIEFRIRRGSDGSYRWHEVRAVRSEEHTSELQSLMRISYAVFCLKTKNTRTTKHKTNK